MRKLSDVALLYRDSGSAAVEPTGGSRVTPLVKEEYSTELAKSRASMAAAQLTTRLPVRPLGALGLRQQ